MPASFASFRIQLVGKGWHTFLLFILGASWGLQFTLLKIATDAELVELGILTVSMALLAATYLLAMAFCRAWFRPTQQHVRFFILSGLFGFVLPLGGVILAAEHLSAGLIVFYESLSLWHFRDVVDKSGVLKSSIRRPELSMSITRLTNVV